MDWMQLLTYASMFCCLGMVQQQQKELTMKEKMNFLHAVAGYHKIGLTLLTRAYPGKRFLDFPCFFSFLMMGIWYVLSADPYMGLWILAWVSVYFVRKFEAYKVGGQVHSFYDGYPYLAKFMPEWAAKMLGEPILFGVLGFLALQYYEENEWSPYGLPFFLLAGTITIPFVTALNQLIWERQLQAADDARLEQEALMQDLKRNRW